MAGENSERLPYNQVMHDIERYSHQADGSVVVRDVFGKRWTTTLAECPEAVRNALQERMLAFVHYGLGLPREDDVERPSG